MNETELIESLSKDVERYCAAAEDTLKYTYEMRNACEKLMDETDADKIEEAIAKIFSYFMLCGNAAGAIYTEAYACAKELSIRHNDPRFLDLLEGR